MAWFIFIAHLIGLVNAGHAVLNVQSARGAVAWVLSLSAFPYVAIPLYWIIGRKRFYGYTEAHRFAEHQYRDLIGQLNHEIQRFSTNPPAQLAAVAQLSKRLSRLPFVSHNRAQLLIDGKETFSAIWSAIEGATDYILVQFYIVREDSLGCEFKELLIDKAKQGVRVYFIYDEIGSHALSKQYRKDLRQHGVKVTAFNSTKGKGNRFQINFRNHRKIVVVDGRQAFIGGLNVGTEYIGQHPRLSPWRDTHLQLQGPAVQCVQVAFLKDWYWAVRELPEVQWTITPVETQPETALVFTTGPSHSLPVCPLFLVSLINAARDRIWITTPYFVPNESVLTALKLAVLRGVEVRILLPNQPDHLMVYLASFAYVAEMQAVGAKLYRYQVGFMHQKVMLIDDAIAGVGTINLDNRSFYLNFEIMALVLGSRFATTVETMLKQDFEVALQVDESEYALKTLGFKLGVRLARLLSPLL